MSDIAVKGSVLRFLTMAGQPAEAEILEVVTPWQPVNNLLRACTVELGDEGTEWAGLRRLLAVSEPLSDSARWRAYELLDNEILAGMRLSRLAAAAGNGHPPQLSRMIGYQPSDYDQFALQDPYRGEPVEAAAGRLLLEDRERFATELIIALRWLVGAGAVHRGLSPRTVRWDGDRPQITDFSQATLIGVPRTPTGTPPSWTAPEQAVDPRLGRVPGIVEADDDVWAAARVIAYVTTGFEVRNAAQLEAANLTDLLGDCFGPPGGRPSVTTLLQRLRVPDPLRRVSLVDEALQEGRRAFDSARSPSVDLREQVTDLRDLPGGDRPAPGDPAAEPGEPRPNRRGWWWGLGDR